jgi:SAM-dependent methyltransferase
MEKEHFDCPLCGSKNTLFFHESEKRRYFHCLTCDLLFVPSPYFVTRQEEKAKYDNHQNTPQNSGYVTFLNRLLDPLVAYLPPKAKGLDFGCGPGPTLSHLMQVRGYDMDIYDPFYAPDTSIFEKSYDFITTTEVIEHMHNPRFELERLWRMLNSGGVLGIMTAFRPEAFATWYYKRDLTHIRFFTPQTFEWIAEHLHASLQIPQSGVAILIKD